MDAFADLEIQGQLRRPVIPEHTTGNGHMFYLLLPDQARRDALIAALKARGIVAPFHYVPLHSAPAGKAYGRTGAPLPVTDQTSACLLRLPLFYTLGDDIDAVIATVHDFFAEAR